MDYYPIGDFAALLGKTTQTLRNWHKQGVLSPAYVTPGGTRYYSSDQLNELLNTTQIEPKRVSVGYCRVSSEDKRAELDEQIERVRDHMKYKGYQQVIITDVGSAADFGRKGLNELIDKMLGYQVDKVVVTNKDRLFTYGFDFFEQMCRKHGSVVEVINFASDSDEAEIMEDMVKVVKGMSSQLKVRRANKVAKLVAELLG
jgi:predicted site-specific integrase-resolvase